MSKPVQIYFHGPSPNPWKVVTIAEELGIPYELVDVDYSDIKQEPYISVNPNGRVPGIRDPNNGDLTLFESGAIIQYFVDVYDKDHKLSYGKSPEKYVENSWAHFQMSGQGPYFGQKAWFSRLHPEKLPSAIERYEKEIHRVLGVIDAHLAKTGKPYLVGDKVTYADLMWFHWNDLTPMLIDPDFKSEWDAKYPKCAEWHKKLAERPSVKKTDEVKAAYMPKQ